MTRWTLPSLNAFMARHDLDLAVTSAEAFTSGFWNQVLHLTTSHGDLVFKQYHRTADNPLFPNLPADEARALQRLHGLDVAPDLMGFWPDEDVLIYHYLPGPEWQDDVTAAAHLLRRQSRADPAGFREVPTTAEAILAQADTILALCNPDRTTEALLACRPNAQTTAATRLSLIHTDPAAANLIGTGDSLRLIDWQCPAAGDLAEDVAVLFSAAFRTLYARPPLTRDHRARFLQVLGDADLTARLPALEPAYFWRLAAYCAHRMQTTPDADLANRYSAAVLAEIACLSRS
ncbi:MAG: phosphotransferase [bacterium]